MYRLRLSVFLYVTTLLLGCLLTATQSFNAQNYEIQDLKIGRGGEHVFASDFFDGYLYFCSDRKAKQASKAINEDNSRFLNLFRIALSEDLLPSKKDEGTMLNDNVNSTLNEGPIFLDRTNEFAYFSSNTTTSNNTLVLELFKSKYNSSGKVFAAREKIDLELPDGNLSNPTISGDGNFLVFSFTEDTGNNSNLYLSKKESEGTWSNPEPIVELNTEHNETFPRWYGNTLFYSSDAPNGNGGLDIYKTIYKNNEFDLVTHLESPINSEYDDFLFIQTSASEGFFSSNRNGQIDRVFKFKLNLPQAKSFVETKIDFCYTMQDETILDETEYDYLWDFGDGEMQNGAIVSHCYKDTGTYLISCHLMNSATLQVEKNIISTSLEISSELPIIEFEENVGDNITARLNQKWSQQHFDNYYWIVGEQIHTEPELNLSTAMMGQTIKVVMWSEKANANVIGISKTLTLK